MNQQVFIPVTDDLIYNHPEQIEGPLVPYSAGMECQNWLSIELNPEDDVPLDVSPRQNKRVPRRAPLHLAYSA